jgi:hypothetical protein
MESASCLWLAMLHWERSGLFSEINTCPKAHAVKTLFVPIHAKNPQAARATAGM